MNSEILVLMKFELVVTIILFIILLLKIGKNKMSTSTLLNMVNILLGVNFIIGFFGNTTGEAFGDMFRSTQLIHLEKNILNLAVLIISLQSREWLMQHKHVNEFYVILLASLSGMFFMISANNMFMFYLGLELSTIPLAALANFDLLKRKSGEAAMKFIISSAFSSGILLFGISLLYGALGTLNFDAINATMQASPLLIMAFVMILAGFAFKMSAVPFHLWTADVYEGAPVAVTAYLSVVSKGAIIFVFVSVLYTAFQNIFVTWYNFLFLISVLTMITGNLFAVRQQNLKRFLAFSSIAQVGFILIGITGNSTEGVAASVFFIVIYLFSNLAAFGVISLVSAKTGKENISDYKGFYKTNPLLAWVLALSLFSLAGIPPTAGFFGKFFLLMSGAGQNNTALIVIAALNMIVSLYYYLKVVKAMFMDNNDAPIQKLDTGFQAALAFVICMAGLLLTGLIGGAYEYIYSIIHL
jgi:NADH-quinone oxidoreductase subunit N